MHHYVTNDVYHYKKQSSISRPSSEAGYRAMANAAAELTWLVRLLEELGVQSLKPVQLHCDNQSAIHIAKNPVFHERTKHIEFDCRFRRDKVLDGLIELSHVRHQLTTCRHPYQDFISKSAS